MKQRSQREMTTYQLHILVKKEIRVKVGKLGVYSFPQGKYVYTGSAKKNIDQRIARHLSKIKKHRWHIDYLLANSSVVITDVVKTKRGECRWNQSIRGDILVNGFGASDCHNGCGSHLKYVGC